MEILSPAGNFEALKSAVRTGADAVYLGLKNFSARRNAENFDFDELRKACEYCHERGVKVYVAINTMIKESEINSALSAAKDAYNCGADALIVSDLGFISALRSYLPQIELHASTQMTVHSHSALGVLKKSGITRVVLAREMSREEIKNFCIAAKKENIEVEVFVHGALCMCVSGKCLLSAVLGGRSGNRGLCAGPCRLEFSSSGKGRYDLSLKDLSLVKYLKELEDLGVSSAKIEGRMKRAEYVAAATAACKSALDGIKDEKLDTALKNVFSRSGFTDGYYKGALGPEMFGVRTKDDTENEKSAFSYLHSLYRSERQTVPIEISAEIKEDMSSVTVKDCDGNIITVFGEKPEKAQNCGVTENTVISALSRLGGTPYYAKHATAEIGNGLYLSAAALNELRRRAIENLGKKRRNIHRSADFKYNKTYKKSEGYEKTKIFAKFLNDKGLPQNLTGVHGVILPVDSDFSAVPDGVVKIAELPRYITNEEKLISRLSILKEQGVFTAYCDNFEAIETAKKLDLKIISSNGLNCANAESIKALKSLGADMVTLSAETNMSDAKALSKEKNVGIFAYGRLPLMLTRNCPVKNTKTCAECGKKSFLTDRMGINFPVICSGNYSEVLNSSPIYLADKEDDLASFGFLILSFTDEPPEGAEKIINDYIRGAATKAKFTRGLYYKNIP